MDKIEIAQRIRKLREARNMTQNTLANNAGVSPTYIYKLEKGEKNPSIEYLDYICWGLGITLEEFFRTEEKQSVIDRIALLTPVQRELLNKFLDSLLSND